MPYSERNGVKTYYEATGEGMPFVMLHANPCDHWMWSYQIANFSHRFRVIAPDMRGYGRTDKPLEIYSFDALVEDVLGVLEQEGVENGILAGASMGSKMAFKLAAARPGLFQAHIHVGGNAFRGTSYDDRIVGYETEEFERAIRTGFCRYRTRPIHMPDHPAGYASDVGQGDCDPVSFV
jgi:pimeloyl-ACP methyl ester carboxylesterase